MSEASYTFFDHAADVGVEVRAGSLEELFVAAGLALMEWMGPQPAAGRRELRDVDVGAEDLESLLVNWLRELHFLFQHRHAYFVGARSLVLSSTEARARAEFSLWEEASYRDYQEVKAITYHQLSVERESSAWRARIIFDI